MDLKQLKYFTKVAELGSYTRAAEVLNVAQPVLSRQIRRLETELHQNLFIRHGRGVTLSDAGHTLLEHSRLILQQLTQAEEDKIGRASCRARVSSADGATLWT